MPKSPSPPLLLRDLLYPYLFPLQLIVFKCRRGIPVTIDALIGHCQGSKLMNHWSWIIRIQIVAIYQLKGT
jgi:hypothetical protein